MTERRVLFGYDDDDLAESDANRLAEMVAGIEAIKNDTTPSGVVDGCTLGLIERMKEKASCHYPPSPPDSVTSGQDVIVDADGNVRMIHDDDIVDTLAEDAAWLNTRRASNVEPIPGGRWWRADMAPVGGPVLGPFATRKFALKQEVAWLREHNLPLPLEADEQGGQS